MGQDGSHNGDGADAFRRAPASPRRTIASAPLLPTRTAPCVRIAGDIDHPDFRPALSLLSSTAKAAETATETPELIVILQSRPGTFPIRAIETLRRAAPLAGIVALVGTWCEGEPRTGRPWPGVKRLYWYEFPAWWQRQLAARARGQCPEWARPVITEWRTEDCELQTDPTAPRSTIIFDSATRETAAALTDILRSAGYATVWQRSCRSYNRFRGAIAGVWDGGQLSDHEAGHLSRFCRQLSADAAPVIALLDFPRRDRVDQALSLGATAILGKPWLNADLITTLQIVTVHAHSRRAA